MESIGYLLIPYSETLAKTAAAVTSIQFLSPIFLLVEIRKKGSTVGYPIAPFLGGIILTLLSLKYGFIIRDDAMIKVNFFGFALNVVYFLFYYFYSPNETKMTVWKQCGISGIISFVLLTWAEYEDKTKIEFRFGILLTVILVFLVGSPLLGLGEIMRKKSTEGLPFPMIVSGSIVSLSWMLYGFSILNTVLVVQNAFLLILALIQLSLFVIYPKKSEIKTKIRKD